MDTFLLRCARRKNKKLSTQVGKILASMHPFHTFVCQHVVANPVLIGETHSSIKESSSSGALDAKVKELLCAEKWWNTPNAVHRTDEVNSVVLRSLVAPLHPFGVGHLIHNIIWSPLMTAEEAARKVGNNKKNKMRKEAEVDQAMEATATELVERENEEELERATFALERAMDKARKIIMLLELYEASDCTSE